jgi:hypothetical protein
MRSASTALANGSISAHQRQSIHGAATSGLPMPENSVPPRSGFLICETGSRMRPCRSARAGGCKRRCDRLKAQPSHPSGCRQPVALERAGGQRPQVLSAKRNLLDLAALWLAHALPCDCSADQIFVLRTRGNARIDLYCRREIRPILARGCPITELEQTEAMLKRVLIDFAVDRTQLGDFVITIATFNGTVLMIFHEDGSLVHIEVKSSRR